MTCGKVKGIHVQAGVGREHIKDQQTTTWGLKKFEPNKDIIIVNDAVGGSGVKLEITTGWLGFFFEIRAFLLVKPSFLIGYFS